ncbi:MAG: anthrone oxygenase family protein [Capsulimonas sp.]|uniref:anthrone oxygenase family protein n=1 Tax=Capsulimonas sp. TaxID=2494211 RepID=UPI0032637F5A
MITLENIVLVCAAISASLMAGLFYAWSCSITAGLGRLPDAEYLGAMQSINIAIQNPVFFAGFFGALFLLPIAAAMQYAPAPGPRFWLLAAAAVAYAVGVIGVSVAGNIPLNEALNSFPLHTATAHEIAAQRVRFESPWNALNTVRTISAVAAVTLAIAACLAPKQNA